MLIWVIKLTKNIFSKIYKLLSPFGILLLIFMILQLLFVHFSGIHYFKFIFRDVWRIAQSIISVIAIFLIIKNISGKNVWISLVSQSIFILVYSTFVGYVAKTKQSFEYSIIADNFNEIFYFESTNYFEFLINYFLPSLLNH